MQEMGKKMCSLETVWAVPEAISGMKKAGRLMMALTTHLSQAAGFPAGPLGSVTPAAQISYEALYSALVVQVLFLPPPPRPDKTCRRT